MLIEVNLYAENSPWMREILGESFIIRANGIICMKKLITLKPTSLRVYPGPIDRLYYHPESYNAPTNSSVQEQISSPF